MFFFFFGVPPLTPEILSRRQEIEDQIRAIYSGDNSAHKDVGHKTVFSELINSDLPPQEKAVERLKHEGRSPDQQPPYLLLTPSGPPDARPPSNPPRQARPS